MDDDGVLLTSLTTFRDEEVSSSLSPPLLSSLEFDVPLAVAFATAFRLIFRDRGTGGVDGWVALIVRDPVRKEVG